MERYCLSCQKPIQGRIDKKFCDDQCRNSYNNVENRDDVNVYRNINNILRRNRRVLKDLNPSGKTRVTKTQLDNKGFNFNYFTNIYQTKAGAVYYFCYDQGYIQNSDLSYTLVLKQDWVN